jgi:exodeoxyribonuclease VII large subunit
MASSMSEAAQLSSLPEFSVSEISGALKRLVEENFAFVRVRGEISGLKIHSSGHAYFDLKDHKASLNAVIWRTGMARLKLKPESGMEVVATGRLTTYAGQSRYQLMVEQLELAGLGALMALLEERKKRLTAEGLFDPARKKKLPFLPEVIGVVTSPTGAVIRDIMHRLNARFPRHVLLWPVAVQGERAAGEIAAAITGFNAIGGGFPKPDLLIVARGGGSVEDLMPFNDEAVVRAAAASRIPLISAVGHETDTTLIDFAADMRAPTPTAAAELAVPVRTELLSQTMNFERRMLGVFTRSLEQRRRHLVQLARVLPRPEQLFAGPRQRLDGAGEKLAVSLRHNLQKHRAAFLKTSALLRPNLLRQRISRFEERLDNLGNRSQRCARAHQKDAKARLDAVIRLLEGVSYRKVLERGFALVKGADGKLRRRAAALKPGETLTLTFADGESAAVAGGTAKPKAKKSPADQGDLF